MRSKSWIIAVVTIAFGAPALAAPVLMSPEWGKDACDAVHNAVVLEFVARLASETLRINPNARPMQAALLDKHFLRKHGPGAYYGQK